MTEKQQSGAARVEISERARDLFASSLVCDTTLPWIPGLENKDGVLPDFHAHGIGFVSLTIAVDDQDVETTVRSIGVELSRLRSLADTCVPAGSIAEIRAAREQGRMAVGFHFQGTNSFSRDAGLVEVYYRLGVRHALLAYNKRNHVADGCHECTDGGISRFGVRLIKEMNRVGMIVDCTHTGYRSSLDAIEISEAPVIFSHSNAWVVRRHARNLRDDQIKACAASGGIIGINGVGHFLTDEMIASPEAMARHMDHVADLVGPEHLAIGIDHVYFLEQQARYRAANPNTYPEGYPPADWTGSYLGPGHVLELTEVLLRRGYEERHVRGILGENFLRVASHVWR